MKIILNLLVSAVAMLLSAYIVPGVTLGGFGDALIAAIVLGLVNVFIEPIVVLLTLPLNILTLGLFSYVITALMVLLTAALVPGFQIEGIFTALIFALVLSLINGLFYLIMPSQRK